MNWKRCDLKRIHYFFVSDALTVMSKSKTYIYETLALQWVDFQKVSRS